METLTLSLAVITSLSYCYLISSRLPKGKWRLISLLPVFYTFAILPLHVSSVFLTAVVSFFLTWLASFKLLLFAFDQGPLPSAKSLPLFITMASLPFQIKTNTKAVRRKTVLPLNLATEIPASVILIQITKEYTPFINPYLVMVLYCCLMFLLVEVLVALSSLVARVLFKMELEPPSDEPYLSTSLREFWGRRWNLTVGGLLRETIYKPIRVALGGGLAARAAGMISAFVVSGLMHELTFWYITPGVSPSWEMTAFFFVQGVGVGVEVGVEKWRRRMPAVVRGVLTLGFVVTTSFWLFYPPVIRNGADIRVIEELEYVWRGFISLGNSAAWRF